MGSGAPGCGSGLGQSRGHARRPHEVHLHGGVQRRVEAHGGGGVDHRLAGRQEVASAVVQAQAVYGHVPGHRQQPRPDHVVEVGAPLVTQPVEAVVAEDVAPGTLLGAPPARSHDDDDLAVGHRAHDPLDHGGAEEAGRPGHPDARSGQRFPDHLLSLPCHGRYQGARR